MCVCFVCRESRRKTLSVCVFCLQRERESRSKTLSVCVLFAEGVEGRL